LLWQTVVTLAEFCSCAVNILHALEVLYRILSAVLVTFPFSVYYTVGLLTGTAFRSKNMGVIPKSSNRKLANPGSPGRLLLLHPFNGLFSRTTAPRGAGALSFPLVHSLLYLLLFFTFSLFLFLIHFTYFLLLSIPSLSTGVVPLRFQAGGHRRRPNLGLVRCVYFMLSVLLSSGLFWCFVVFDLVSLAV